MFAALFLAATIPATVLSATDGDTIRVHAQIWPGVTTEAVIRLRGIDAAERNAPCEKARRLGRAAHLELKKLEGRTVYLREIAPGKYARRHVARVFTAGGEDVGAMLISRNFAKPYDGKGPRPSHCL